MRLNTKVTFAMRDLDRLKCVQAVVDGDLKPMRAADRLGLSTRQVRRLARRYAASGPAGLISKRFNRPSNNRTDDALADAVIKILRSTYADFGPTLATEKLRTQHGIDLAKETVRQLQIATGLWIPRKHRLPKVQQPRMRRACLGELVQIDGCEHPWFEDRAPVCTALVYVDDATSRLMHILFTGTESTFGYFEATRQYFLRHGKPLAFYSDKASIFRVNHASATGGAGHTQFGRALYELNIDGICANTPAAKGRVERAHLTLQDRLVKELRLQGISTIEAANAFMLTYMADYNSRFAKVPRQVHDAHRPVRQDENLDLIFSWREQRRLTEQLTLRYERKLYSLKETKDLRRYAGKYVDVYQFPDGRIEVRVGGASIPYHTYDKIGEIDQGAIVENKRLNHALRISSMVQANRDNRRAAKPSTAHRSDGKPVQYKKLPGTKRSREFNEKDLRRALEIQQQTR
jgi:Winged helix-turn helix